jgi:hypothetical protein
MQTATTLLCAGVLLLSGTAAVQLAAQEPASRIRACVGPSGAIRIVSAEDGCRATESLLEWTTEPPTPPPAPTPTPGAGLRVINAFGLDVGSLLNPSIAVLTLPTGQKAYAEVYPAGAPANWAVNQYYQTPDCSGEPLVTWTAIEEVLPPALVRRSGVWALRPGSLARRTLGSWRSVGDSGPSPTCHLFTASFDTWQFDFYAPEQVGLVYPLTVE